MFTSKFQPESEELFFRHKLCTTWRFFNRSKTKYQIDHSISNNNTFKQIIDFNPSKIGRTCDHSSIVTTILIKYEKTIRKPTKRTPSWENLINAPEQLTLNNIRHHNLPELFDLEIFCGVLKESSKGTYHKYFHLTNDNSIIESLISCPFWNIARNYFTNIENAVAMPLSEKNVAMREMILEKVSKIEMQMER